MMTLGIPCLEENCLLLGICRQKSRINCDKLYKFVSQNMNKPEKEDELKDIYKLIFERVFPRLKLLNIRKNKKGNYKKKKKMKCPCDKCICVAICRNQPLDELWKKCRPLDKFLFRFNIGSTNIYDLSFKLERVYDSLKIKDRPMKLTQEEDNEDNEVSL